MLTKHHLLKTVLSFASFALPLLASANGMTIHVGGGLGISKIESTQSIWINPSVENKYTTSSRTDTSPFMTIGMGYQWDHFNTLPHLAINLSLSAYLFERLISGINTPFINGGSFDTLNYSMQNNVNALFFEPKLIYTAYAWQPYVMVGMGVAANQLSDYSESPTESNSTASAMPYPFQNKTQVNFAYSFGVGVQHTFWKDEADHSLTLALGYHAINFGKMALGTYRGQTTNAHLTFNKLSASFIGADLIWQY